MGLKGSRLWAMGQLVIRSDPSNVQAYAIRGLALCLKVGALYRLNPVGPIARESACC
jgi:hypothetical protein